MKKTLLISLFTLMLVGCKEDDPCEISYSGENYKIFIFDLVDKTTGENLFTNGTLNIDDIQCYDENNTIVPYSFLDVNDRPSIVYSFPKLGLSTYNLKVSPDIEILIEFEIIEIEEECRTYKETKKIEVLNYEYEISEYDNLYKIFI